MSAHGIARTTLEAALSDATAANVDAEVVLRALIAASVEAYREREGVASTCSMLAFQLENCAGDEDYEFMRP
ncbi:MAG: hypothetical protein AAF648_12280 [Pseudomonadota bacterium]